MRKEKSKTNLGRPIRTESTANSINKLWAGPTKIWGGGGRWLLYTDQVGVKQLPGSPLRRPRRRWPARRADHANGPPHPRAMASRSLYTTATSTVSACRHLLGSRLAQTQTGDVWNSRILRSTLPAAPHTSQFPKVEQLAATS
jgi:hypothetical protein